MRIIQVTIQENHKLLIEINKSIYELTFNELENIGLSSELLDKLKTAILRAQEKKLNSFTLKY